MPEHTEVSTRTQTLTLGLTVKGAAEAIGFYKKAFGAEEIMRMPGPGSKGIMHAELRIGDSVLFLSDEFPEMGSRSPETLGGISSSIYLLVDDVDSVFKRALEAGAKGEMAVEDMFWGDRAGSLIDPFGHHWMVATHKEDLSPEEMRKRTEEFFVQMTDESKCNNSASI